MTTEKGNEMQTSVHHEPKRPFSKGDRVQSLSTGKRGTVTRTFVENGLMRVALREDGAGEAFPIPADLFIIAREGE
jgi:hypothetical protein